MSSNQKNDENMPGSKNKISGKLENFLGEMRALEETIEREKAISAGAQAQVREMQVRFEQIVRQGTAQNQALKVDKDKLEKLLAAHQTQIRNLETRCGGAVEENKGLKAQIARFQQMIPGLERQAQDNLALRQKLEELSRAQASVMQSAQEEQTRRKELERESAELKNRLEDAIAQNQALDSSYREESQRASSLQTELVGTAQTLNATTQELRDCQTRVRNYAERISELQAYQTVMENALRNIERTTEEKFRSQSLENIELVKSMLRDELERKAAAEIEKLRADLTAANEANSALKRQIQSAQFEHDNQFDRATSAENRASDLENRISSHVEREAALNAEIRRLKTAYPLRDLLVAKDFEIHRLRGEIDKITENDPEREKMELILRSLIAQREQVQMVLADNEKRALRDADIATSAPIAASEADESFTQSVSGNA